MSMKNVMDLYTISPISLDNLEALRLTPGSR